MTETEEPLIVWALGGKVGFSFLGGKVGFSFFGKNIPSVNIRGKQIAERIGGRLNPTEGYKDDVCIYIKALPEPPIPKRSYIDLLDWKGGISWCEEHPEVGVIAFTRTSQFYLSEKLKRSDIKLIPQHHCNFKNRKRPDRGVRTAGFIGGRRSFLLDPKEVEKRLNEIGLQFIYKLKPKSRNSVLWFYHDNDIQICFRPKTKDFAFKDSLKIANAGSYGIPTVTWPEPDNIFAFPGCFAIARNLEEIIKQCKRLKEDRSFYREISERVLLRSQDYHIDKIIPLYQGLA